MHDGMVRETVGDMVKMNEVPNSPVPKSIQRQFSLRGQAESESKGLGNGKGHLFDKSMRTRLSLLSEHRPFISPQSRSSGYGW